MVSAMHIHKVKTENSKLKSMVSAMHIHKVKTQNYGVCDSVILSVITNYSSMYLSML